MSSYNIPACAYCKAEVVAMNISPWMKPASMYGFSKLHFEREQFYGVADSRRKTVLNQNEHADPLFEEFYIC